MKKKYIIVLSIIGSLLLFNLVLATGYGLLVATKNDKAKKGLSIAGSLISILGTFNFVKPFLIKDKNLTEEGK